MEDKEFILQRICNFAGQEFDPNSDEQVENILRKKFNVYLPQRRSMNDSLVSCISDHEIIKLIKEYRGVE